MNEGTNGNRLHPLVRARTCDGCKALEMLQGTPPICRLGYKFDSSFRPLAPCPKPRTISQFISCTNSLLDRNDPHNSK